MTHTYVIASERPWNAALGERLAKKTGHKFVTISLKDSLLVDELKKLSPRFVFFPHWSHKIPESIWGNFESVIFHMTDLPYGRGGSPLQNLIMQGHQETVMTALRCVEALDAGPIYLKAPLALSGTAEEIFYRADAVIEEMILKILTEELIPVAQEGEPTFFKRRKPEDGNLKCAECLDVAFDMIRMLDAKGYPNAFLNTDRLNFRFKKAKKHDNHLEAVVIIEREKEIS